MLRTSLGKPRSALLWTLLTSVLVTSSFNAMSQPTAAKMKNRHGAPTDAASNSTATTKTGAKSRGRAETMPSGYVLTHEHPTNAMAFGGNYAFTGAPHNFRNGIMQKGYTAECGGCKALTGCDHGEFKGSLAENIMGASDMGDHSSHKGPLHNSFSHSRYSTEWIKEAWKPSEAALIGNRLRLMVAFAVENEAMCEQLYYANQKKGGPGGAGYPCSHGDSKESLERQLEALKAWVKENDSWMEIAYTPNDARRIAAEDKLVIVLGIESEYSFGAEDRKFDPVDRLNQYYEEGVRTFYLAHKINSRLAGADIYWSDVTQPGKAIRATQAISGCFYVDDAVAPFPLRNTEGHNFCDNNCGTGYFKGNKLFGITEQCSNKFSEISEINMADYVMARGDTTFNGFKIYPVLPGFRGPGGTEVDKRYTVDVERNRLGLSHDGERVVREAMTKGMIVNIDHISSQGRRDVQVISKDFGGYPLNAFHVNPNNMLVGNKGDLDTPFPHEYDFDDEEIKMIKNTDGFLGVRLGPVDAKDNIAKNSGVDANCPKTATETAKILAYLMDMDLTLGYSLDYATVTQGIWSRTLANCGKGLGGGDEFHKYESEKTEGLSHIGMMKYFHRELQAVGLKKTYLDRLKADGPEAFIRMWERSEERSKLGKQIPRQTFAVAGGRNCATDEDCAAGKFCSSANFGLSTRTCKSKKVRGDMCVDKSECVSNRCAWGSCAEMDECRSNSDCKSSEYCGDPLAGKASCKALHKDGESCSKSEQCRSKKCSVFQCR